MFLTLNFLLDLILDNNSSFFKVRQKQLFCMEWKMQHISIPKLKILGQVLYTGMRLSTLKFDPDKLRSIICTCIFFFFHFNRAFPQVNSDLRPKLGFL